MWRKTRANFLDNVKTSTRKLIAEASVEMHGGGRAARSRRSNWFAGRDQGEVLLRYLTCHRGEVEDRGRAELAPEKVVGIQDTAHRRRVEAAT